MLRRAALLAAVSMLVTVLSGCGSLDLLRAHRPGELVWPGTVAAQPFEAPAAIGAETVHAARAVLGSWNATVAVPSPHHAGVVIEDQAPRQRAYRLDTGDRLRVFVYGQPNLSRLYNVDQSGNISVPLIGNVRARGLTTIQLEGSIRNRLSQGLVRDPQVTVDVQQNRPFFILGEVRTPGQYPYVTGMTIEMAVAIAGGYGDRANERKMRLSRRAGGVVAVIDVSVDTEIEPGDTIYVYERFF